MSVHRKQMITQVNTTGFEQYTRIIFFSYEYQLEDTIFSNRYLTDIVELELPLEKKLDQIEATFLSEALCVAEHNKNKAAELLGITFRSFRYKIDKHKNIVNICKGRR